MPETVLLGGGSPPATLPLTGTETTSILQGGEVRDILLDDLPGGGGGGSGTVTSVSYALAAAVADILSVTGSPITTSGTITVDAVDPGADRLLFWDDSAGKLTHLTLGTNLSITGTTIDAASGGGGAMALVSSQTVSGSAVTTVTFSGLDLATAGRYQLEMSIINATASAPALSLFFNGDTTAGNYRSQITTSTGASLSAGGNNNAIIFGIAASSYAFSLLDIKRDISGRPRTLGSVARDEPASYTRQDFTHIRTNTANVTDLTISSSVASAIGVGSVFKLYRIG